MACQKISKKRKSWLGIESKNVRMMIFKKKNSENEKEWRRDYIVVWSWCECDLWSKFKGHAEKCKKKKKDCKSRKIIKKLNKRRRNKRKIMEEPKKLKRKEKYVSMKEWHEMSRVTAAGKRSSR